MDLSKYPPHVVATFHRIAESRAKDAYEQGRAAGREEVMAGLNALRAFLPPGGFPATPPAQLPPLTAVAAPVMLSQPTGTVSETDTGGDDFDLDGLIDELVGENDPQVRQLILAMAMSALTEAYQAQGKDPTPVLKKLREMAKNGAVQAATGGDEVWLAWTAAQTKGGKVKAVGTDEHQGRTLYGKQAESALRSQEKRGKQTEARARRDDLVAKIDSGELFAEQDWEDFSGHLESLTGAELKDLRGRIKTALQDKMNRGVLKAGQKKSDRVANLQTGVKNLIQHAIEQAELPDPSREKGKISNLIASMGGIRPDDPEFERATGFTVRQAVAEKIIPRSAVRKDGKRFSDLVTAMKDEGHIYVQDADDGSEGDYNNAVGQAIIDGRTTSNIDVYNPEEVFQKELARKSVRDRLVLARLRRDDPEEYARQRAAILGEAEAESDPVAGEDYPADWDEVGQPAVAQDERPDEYADYLADAETPAEEDAPNEEAVGEPMLEKAPEPVAEVQAEPEPVAEKPVDQMTDAERQAELVKLMAEQEAEMDDERPRKKKKKRPAQAQATETPPAPAKSANPPPADPVPARTEQAPVQTDEEFEAEFQREMAAEREKRRADLKARREQLLADPKFAPPKEVAPKSEKVIERPKDRPLTEAEQERLARERIDANQPQDGEEGPTAEDLRAAEGEAEAAVADASGEYANPTAPTPVVGQAGKTASQQVDEEKQRRIEAMQARIAAGKGVLSDEAPPPPEDDEEKDLYAADYTERAQPEVAKKGKAGRRSLANNQSALFETRLNRDSKEAAAKAVKAFQRTGEVPPVPKVVRDAFKNAPDKDKLDSLWKTHIEQLAGEGGAAKKADAPAGTDAAATGDGPSNTVEPKQNTPPAMSVVERRKKDLLERAAKIPVTDGEYDGRGGNEPNVWLKYGQTRYYDFDTSAGKYMIESGPSSAIHIGKGQDAHVLLFRPKASQGDGYKITGAGAAHEVFSGVTSAVTALVSKTQPPALFFSAAEPSRAKLYDRMVASLGATVPGYEAYSVETPDGGKKYMLVKPEFATGAKKQLEKQATVNAERQPTTKPEAKSVTLLSHPAASMDEYFMADD